MPYKIINRKKLILTILADAVGRCLFWPGNLMRRTAPVDPAAVRSILVVRTAHIGDVVMTLPILKPLRQQFPHARISFLTADRAAPILVGNPWVDEVITYEPFWFYPSRKRDYLALIRRLRRRRFDVVIEARGDIRELLFLVAPLTADHKVSCDVGGGRYLLTDVVPYPGPCHKVRYHLAMAEYLGCRVDAMEWGIHLSADEQQAADGILARHGVHSPFACAHPGSRMALKRWPVDKCTTLYDAVLEQSGLPLVILGAAQDGDIVDAVVGGMNGKPICLERPLSLRELAGVLSKAELLICNDSAPMHIAAAMQTPTVAIFGPSKSVETAPYGAGHRVIEEDFPCRYSCDESSCRNPDYHGCMAAIEPERVLQAVLEVLAAGQ